MDDDGAFPSNLIGWRRDVLDVSRPLIATAGVVFLSAVLLVAAFGGGSATPARNGGICLVLLLLLGPSFLPPFTYWADWTAVREGDQIYVETFLGGRRVLRVSEVRRVATRKAQGRGGTTYYAAIWASDRRTPSVILTWAADNSPTRALVRDLASQSLVRVSQRARAHLDLADAPNFIGETLLACRTLTFIAVYTAAVGCIGWEYAYLLGGELTPVPFGQW